MTDTTTITRADKGQSKASNFIAVLAAHDPAMPLSVVQVLLYIHENRNRPEGITLKELRTDLGLSSLIASRSVRYWEEMVAVEIHPGDRRERLLRLNPKGQAFVRKLERTIA